MSNSTPDYLQQLHIKIEWKKLVRMPVGVAGGFAYPVFVDNWEPEHFKLNVFIQGNLEKVESKPVFLTVHDIGKNHLSFVDFVNIDAMASIKEKAIFVHVCVPGQQAEAKDFRKDFSYPPMDVLGEAVEKVMAKMNIKKCVAIGEGAGADIVCRFAMKFGKYVDGLVLIHCTSTTHGVMEHIREILSNLNLEDGEMNGSAWNYLLTHQFGNHEMESKKSEFVERVRAKKINESNLSRYIYSFATREDFTEQLHNALKGIHAILITGANSPHNENVRHMFEHMDKSNTGLVVVENAHDVLEEAPDHVAVSLKLLCKRMGIIMSEE